MQQEAFRSDVDVSLILTKFSIVVGSLMRVACCMQVYWKNEHPRFPDGGKMSQYLEALPIGGEMEVKGPLGHMHYLGQNKYGPNPCS